MAMIEIWKKRKEIDDARRIKVLELIKEYDEQIYRPALSSLIEQCSNIGHEWHIKDLNPVGYPIYRCNQCGKTEIRIEK